MINEKDVSLVFSDAGVAVARDEWVDANNLLEEFFPRLKALLESNSLSLEDIESYALETDVPTGFTTVRVAQTLVSTLNFALEQ